LRLSEVAAATRGRVHARDADRVVTAVSTDSREVAGGALFVALRGERRDGHAFVRDALAAGAVGYLAERPVEGAPGGVLVEDTWRALAELARAVRERVDPTVVALTGSVGKTTTKDLTAAAIGAERRTVAAEGSFNNELGVPLTCLAVRADTEVLVAEVGSRGLGHIAALMPVVQPDVGVVTAVAAAHLQMFGDVDTVARAKAELVEALPQDGTAILNADDPRVVAMAARTDATVLTCGRRRGADVSARDVRLDRLARVRFRAVTPWGEADVRLPLAGEHHVANALAALAAAGVIGVDVAAAAAAVADAPVAPWRSEVAEVDGVVVLNDAYNANPSSTRAALTTLVGVARPAQGRVWAVLGPMAELGEASRAGHEAVGRLCADLGVDRLVLVGGGDVRSVADGARDGGMPPGRLHAVDDVAAALDLLHREVATGDVVLVKASRVGGLEQVAAGLLQRRVGGT
ncbi:MAG TPA: UDP-N-acetylmuramoyl-tripeptide--D-alanyl-D-alanine ligase, partial [Nitriliruptorales bacterium]|nr:UDP-N-acetylmuramoyl-tripeptide--D-alanyl-D-alanine ligase [Nitriliruptorales bacterium]